MKIENGRFKGNYYELIGIIVVFLFYMFIGYLTIRGFIDLLMN